MVHTDLLDHHASRLLLRQFEQGLHPLGFGLAYLPTLMALHKKRGAAAKALGEHARIEQIDELH